ncbi:MAG: hypothetical protein ACJAXX_002425 [Roseivirga sp.]|jgi:hypothetical protein
MQNELIVTDTLNLILPRSINHPLSDLSYFWSHDGESFSFLSRGSLDSLFINRYAPTKGWLKTLVRPYGPNQVYSAGAFAFNSDTSFYYFPSTVSKILSINSLDGKVYEEFDYSPLRLERIRRNNNRASIYVGQGLIGFDLVEYRPLEEESTFYESFIYGLYKSDSLHKIIRYPEEFHGKVWSSNDVDRNSVVVDEKIYFNFSKSPYIYVYDFEGEMLGKHKVGSDRIKESESGRVDNAEINMFRRENNGYYTNLIYDKWRKVFYRIGIYYDTKEQMYDIKDLARIAKKRMVTITTFNKDFKTLAYNEFALNSKMDERLCFVNEEGLFLLNRGAKTEDDLNFYQLNLVSN